MSNVVELNCVTTLDTTVERVLRKAAEADLTRAVVIGRKPDGEPYFISSVADGGTVLWDMEQIKLMLLNVQVPQ